MTTSEDQLSCPKPSENKSLIITQAHSKIKSGIYIKASKEDDNSLLSSPNEGGF